MDVTVERYLRRKIVTDSASPQFFYLRQKPGTCKTVDIDTLATAIQKSCAMTKGDVKHVIEALVEEVQENLANGNKVKLNQFGTFDILLSGSSYFGRVYGEEYQAGEYPFCTG